MTELALYMDAKLQPQVEDVLKELFTEFPEVTDTYQWTELLDRTIPVLVLGNMPPVTPINYVKTLSQKQILANPASLTELRVAVRRLLTPPTFPPMRYKVYDGDDVAPLFKLGNVVVVDIETGGDIHIMLPEETWLLSVALNDGVNDIIVLGEEWLKRDANREKLKRFLLAPQRKLIAHNMKFDFRTLTAHLGCDIKGHHCTMLMHHSINPGAKEHDLKKTCAKYLGAPDWDAGTKKYVKGNYKVLPDNYPKTLKCKYAGRKVGVGFENIPRAELYEYNAYDVYWTWYLFEFLARAAKGEERIARIARFEFGMSNFFQDVEKTGVAVDLEYLEELRQVFTEEETKLKQSLCDITDNPTFNGNSPQQVKKFYESIGIPLKSTAEGILVDLELDEATVGGQFTNTLLEQRGVTKMKGTYVDGILKRTHDGIVYPDFLVHGTSTGRLSSRDPNIQNIPRDEEGQLSLRRIFIPRDVETRSLISVDYSQAELRVMACMSQDEYLISLFQPGMPDFFVSLMPTAYPNEDLDMLDKATLKNMRAKLKGVIYGMSYGRKARAIAKALGMSVRDAQSIITNYFKAAPSLLEWRKWVMDISVDPTRTMVSPFGRYYQAEVVTGRTRQNIINSGLSFLPQSTASDICVTAAMEVHKWLGQYDAYIIATIHDAILIDGPDKHIQVISDRVQQEMKDAAVKVFGTVVPFDTEATHGKSWYGI